MLHRPLLFLLLLAVGCAHSAPPRAAAEASQTSDPRFVLIWTDARLHRSPDDPEPVRAYDYGGDARSARAGEVYVARLVADHGAWLEVDTGPIDWLDDANRPYHCASSNVLGRDLPAGSGGVALRLWVRRADLAPVLTRPFDRSFDDGTYARLRPGTPIVDGRPWIDGFLLPIQVEDAAIGTNYRVLPLPPATDDDGFRMQDVVEVRAALGGAEVSWQQPPWNYSESPYLLVDDAGTRVTTSDAGCGEAVLAFTGRVAPSEFDQYGIGGLSTGRVPGVRVAEGTPLQWPDGTPAGTVLEALELRVPATGPAVCFEVGVGWEWKSPGFQADRLEVCVPPDAAIPADVRAR